MTVVRNVVIYNSKNSRSCIERVAIVSICEARGRDEIKRRD